MVYTVNGVQFTRRKKIKLSHSGALTDYQLKLTITYETAMQADFDDIRFSTLAGVNIPYWIQSKTNSSTADIWIKYDQADGDTYIYMHYGNSGLSSASNGSDVFIQYHGSSSSNYLDSVVISVPYIWEGNIWRGDATAQIKFGVSNTADPYDGAGDSVFMLYPVGGDKMYGYTNNDGSRSNNNQATSWINNQRYKTKIVAAPALITYTRETGSLNFTINSNIPNESGGLVQSIVQGTGGHDWAFIRKYTATDPTSSIETEQHQRRTPQFI